MDRSIDLFCGWPNSSLLPVAALHCASSIVLSTSSIYTPGLLYGPDDGYPPLRSHIARWLTSFYRPSHGDSDSHPISPDRITITGGASQNLACALQVFSDPVYTRHVWMVEPTYHLAARIMDDSGFAGRLRGVPEDEEGVDVGFLERELKGVERKREEEEGNDAPVCQVTDCTTQCTTMTIILESPRLTASRNTNPPVHGERSTNTSSTASPASPTPPVGSCPCTAVRDSSS